MSLWSRVRDAFAGSSDAGARAAGASGADVADLDEVYGTGLWRAHRDRFVRAVDRYYETAVALRNEADGPGGADSPAGSAAETVARGTVVLNALTDRVDALIARLHAEHPVEGSVIPATVRAHVGQTSELLSRAAGTVSEACQAAAMSRVAVRTGGDPAGPAGSAAEFVERIGTLVDRCEQEVP
ncbi:hypothetical protein [Brevibacterium litoralis]|uniref:hypothetical protein n=1 Tax=Brevibacterium litoralis TaxID=3138935 RepID=UPI0032EC698D